MNHPRHLPLRGGLHTVPEQAQGGGEGSFQSEGSVASNSSLRKKAPENSSSEATGTSATRSSSRPSSDRRLGNERQPSRTGYDPQVSDRNRRPIREEEELRRRRQRRRTEDEARRRRAASQPQPQANRYSESSRIRRDPRYSYVQDNRQSRRYPGEESDYYYYEEPRRQSSSPRGYTEAGRQIRATGRSRASAAPRRVRNRVSFRAEYGTPSSRSWRTRDDSQYYYDEVDDDYDSYASIGGSSYFYEEEEDPPLEERVYVDAAGRPYRVIAPVEPRRRLYRPGSVGLTAPIPPPTRNLRSTPGLHRPSNVPVSSSRRSQRDYDAYANDPYRRRPRASRQPRRPHSDDYEAWEEEDEEVGLQRRGRLARPRRHFQEEEEEERPRERSSAQPTRCRQAIEEQPNLKETIPEDAEFGLLLPDDDPQNTDEAPRDRRGRLQRRHSIEAPILENIPWRTCTWCNWKQNKE